MAEIFGKIIQIYAHISRRVSRKIRAVYIIVTVKVRLGTTDHSHPANLARNHQAA